MAHCTACWCGKQAAAASRSIGQLQQQLAQVNPATTGAASQTGGSRKIRNELVAAFGLPPVAHRLDSLLQALEQAQFKGIALLQVQPMRVKSQLELAGEALSEADLHDYLRRLQQTGRLREAVLNQSGRRRSSRTSRSSSRFRPNGRNDEALIVMAQTGAATSATAGAPAPPRWCLTLASCGCGYNHSAPSACSCSAICRRASRPGPTRSTLPKLRLADFASPVSASKHRPTGWTRSTSLMRQTGTNRPITNWRANAIPAAALSAEPCR